MQHTTRSLPSHKGLSAVACYTIIAFLLASEQKFQQRNQNFLVRPTFADEVHPHGERKF